MASRPFFVGKVKYLTGARIVDEEERTDYITEVLRRAMKPKLGESLDEV